MIPTLSGPSSSTVTTPLDLDHIIRSPRMLLKQGRSIVQPDTSLVELADGGVVIKDITPRPLLARVLWASMALRHEHRVLERLAGLGISPLPLGYLTQGVLVMEEIRGTVLPRHAKELVDDGFFAEMASRLSQMHALGVAHGDIRRTNIMVLPDGSPRLVDFASATLLGGPPRGGWQMLSPRRWLFEVQRRGDLIQIEKIRRVVMDTGLDIDGHYPWYLRIGRWLRQSVYGRLKRLRESAVQRQTRSQHSAIVSQKMARRSRRPQG